MSRFLTDLILFSCIVSVFCDVIDPLNMRAGGKPQVPQEALRDWFKSRRCETPPLFDCNSTKVGKPGAHSKPWGHRTGGWGYRGRHWGGRWNRPGRKRYGEAEESDGGDERRGRGLQGPTGPREGKGRGRWMWRLFRKFGRSLGDQGIFRMRGMKNRRGFMGRGGHRGERSDQGGQNRRGWFSVFQRREKYYFNESSGQCLKVPEGQCGPFFGIFFTEEQCQRQCGDRRVTSKVNDPSSNKPAPGVDNLISRDSRKFQTTPLLKSDDSEKDQNQPDEDEENYFADITGDSREDDD